MELLYPGYKSYFSRFRTKPFHTEYTTRYCNSEAPELYSQVPRYTWYEPRRPTVANKRELEGNTKLTHLRPPFAARMTSYEPERRYLGGKMGCEEATLLGGSGSAKRKDRPSVKLPEVSPSFPERGLPREKFEENYDELQMARMSPTKHSREAITSPKQAQFKTLQYKGTSGFEHGHMSGSLEPRPPVPRLGSSFGASRAQKFHKAPRSSTRDEHSEEALTSNSSTMRRVAPRPSTLLSKHAKDVRYVRDTCFFQPTQERKKHYYIVNPNWFSEQRVPVPKNNVFS